MAIAATIIFPIFILVFLGLPVLLQIFLSKQENPKLGRIPGTVYLIFAVLMLIGAILNPDSMSGFFLLTFYFAIYSMILLVIHTILRRKYKSKRRNSEIDKTNILDL